MNTVANWADASAVRPTCGPMRSVVERQRRSGLEKAVGWDPPQHQL